MELNGYVFPDDLLYDRHHAWARVEEGVITCGVTDFAQKLAGEIVYVELPRKGRKVEQEKPLLSLESGKWVGRVYAPFTGEVLEANTSLEDDASPVNADPYGEGWIVRLKVDPATAQAETANLLKAGPALEEFIRSEMTRIEKEKAEKRG
ncbi:MAG: glycine cleavage system protein H [Firmicutes bacterium]|nr:glycine cleavage system protein H [Bacillota bacterium]